MSQADRILQTLLKMQVQALARCKHQNNINITSKHD